MQRVNVTNHPSMNLHFLAFYKKLQITTSALFWKSFNFTYIYVCPLNLFIKAIQLLQLYIDIYVLPFQKVLLCLFCAVNYKGKEYTYYKYHNWKRFSPKQNKASDHHHIHYHYLHQFLFITYLPILSPTQVLRRIITHIGIWNLSLL